MAASYVLGGFPFGYWWCKRIKGKNFDIRNDGSGNTGWANCLRALGFWKSLPVLFGDALKGLIPVLLCRYAVSPIWAGACMLAAGLGHAKSWYFFLKEGVFSGGKSVATIMGGLIVLQPALAGVAFATFLVVLATWRIVSLGSLLASLCAYAGSYYFHLGSDWNWIMGLVAALICYNHRRNIGRLINGCESRIGLKPATGEIVSAFVFHPLSIDDFGQSRLTCWIPDLVKIGMKVEVAARQALPRLSMPEEGELLATERLLRWFIAKAPVMEAGEITGIVTADGRPGRVLILAVPLLPDQIKDKANRQLLAELLKAAVVQAERQGAKVATLGALLSSESPGGGEELQEWCRQRGLVITIDNGAAMTVAATLELVRLHSPVPLDQAVVATIGARGAIGTTVIRWLRGKVARRISISRQLSIPDDPDSELILDLAPISEADIVVCATSADHAIITADESHLIKQGALVVDVAVPPDVSNDAFIERPDVTLARSGMMLLPGNPQNRINFHFGTHNTESGTVYLLPACLAQGFILAATGEFGRASRTNDSVMENVPFFVEHYQKLGLRIVTSSMSERTVFSAIATN